MADAQRRKLIFINDSNRKDVSVIKPGNNSFKLITFNPETIQVQTEVQSATLLTLMQQYYHGWKIYVNGQERQPFVSDYLFMSVPLKQGDSNVEFRYENKPVKNAARISFATLLILSATWIGLSFKGKKS